MKKSFVLYIDNYEPIKLLTLVQKGQLLDYMFRYNLGIEIDIDDPVLKMAFSFFEQTFIRDNKKWNDTAERNRKNGSKGGRPIKNDSNNLDDNPKNPEEPSGLLDNPENPVGARKAVSVSVSVIVNGFVIFIVMVLLYYLYIVDSEGTCSSLPCLWLKPGRRTVASRCC
jgi:hypothetical protein